MARTPTASTTHRNQGRNVAERPSSTPAHAAVAESVALASGPHINLMVVPPPSAELAWKELTLAKENAADTTEVERDLIEALSHRYANPQPQDRAPLDQAYADAMRAAGGKADIASLPERGITGNSHMMMMDRNNRAVLDVIAGWLVDNGLADN